MPPPPNQPNIQRLANMAMREMLRTMVQTEARPLNVAERLAVKLRTHRPLIRFGLMKPLREVSGMSLLAKFGKPLSPPCASETIKFRRWLPPDAPSSELPPQSLPHPLAHIGQNQAQRRHLMRKRSSAKPHQS